MTPGEMQAIINGLHGDLHNLYTMATEPHQTPVHPDQSLDLEDRSESPQDHVSEEEVEEVIQSVIDER